MKSVSRWMAGLTIAGCALACTSAFASPAAWSAPRTRADVRAELIEWRAAGYDPLDWVDYPENAQRAGAIVARSRAERAAAGAPAPERR